LNKNKKKRKAKLNGVTKDYRDRTGKILFVDLRRWGSEYEKKFVEITPEDISKIAQNFHNWQAPQPPEGGENILKMSEEGMKNSSVLGSANPALYKELSTRAKEMRANPTPAEKILWEKLKNKQLGIKFRQQHIVNKFIVDFCSIEKALLIEVDGEIHDNHKEADRQRSEILKKEGYSVVRFSNDEIINNIDNVISIIKSKTEKSPSGDLGAYKNIPEYCYSASFEEIRSTDFSLVPSKIY